MPPTIEPPIQEPNFFQRLKNNLTRHPIIWLAGIFISSIPIINFFDIPIPRPVWTIHHTKDLNNIKKDHDSDINYLKRNHFSTRIELLEEKGISRRLALYSNFRAQDPYKKENKDAPEFLIKEQFLLEREIEKISDKLKQAQSKLDELSGQSQPQS